VALETHEQIIGMRFQHALLVSRVDRNDTSNQGVINKLVGQVDGLEQLGIEVDYITHSGYTIHLNQKVIKDVSTNKPHLLFKFQFWKYLPRQLASYDLLIIRHTLVVPSLLKWLWEIRKSHPQLTIIIDMPTYPYELEWKGWKKRLGLYFDRQLRMSLHNYVDYMFHSGEEKEIYGIPTLKLGNGITPSNYEKIKSSSHSTIKMVAVGKWQYWHGLDRLLKGLHSYSGERQVELIVVGDGPVLNDLKQMSQELGIEDHVNFVGVHVGTALDEIFAIATIFATGTVGIGTLALHRKQVTYDSSLKHRAYCVRGLPFVASSQDVDFPKDLGFVHYIPVSENEIDIKKLIDFVDRLDQEVGQKMKNYANENLAWSVKFKKLLEHL